MDGSGGPLAPQAPSFTAVLADGEDARTLAVAELLSDLDARGVPVVRVGNPLRSPLTFGRFLIQVAGPAHDPIAADDPHRVVQAVIGPERRDQPVVLLIEQAETLHTSMLRVLQSIAPLLAGNAMLSVILVGRPEFRRLLAADGLDQLQRLMGFAFPADRGGDATDTAAGLVGGDTMPTAEGTELPGDRPPEEPDASRQAAASARRRAISADRPVAGPESPSNEFDQPAPTDAPQPADLRPAVAIPLIPVDRLSPGDTGPGGPATAATGGLRAPERPVSGSFEPERRRRSKPLVIALIVMLVAGAGIAASLQILHGVFYRDVPPRPMSGFGGPERLPPLPGPVPSNLAPDTPPAPPALAEPPAQPAPPVLKLELTAPQSMPVSPPLPVAPSPAIAPLAEAPDRTARLRRDFEDFLDRSGQNVASLSDAQRAGLFNEYVAWRARNMQAPPAPRIVLHVPSGAAAGALGARLAATLDPQPGSVETRRVTNAPNRPNIRFFHSADAAAARQTAAWLSEAGLVWEIRDFSGAQTRASPGTIEVWLPAQP